MEPVSLRTGIECDQGLRRARRSTAACRLPLNADGKGSGDQHLSSFSQISFCINNSRERA
jgi:hypothetical protein